MAFSLTTESRAWCLVIHIQALKNMGLTDELIKDVEYIAKYLCDLWEASGTGRTAAATVCVSAQGVYHIHLALCGNTTTLRRVKSIYPGAHIEPQLGNKKALTRYMLKSPPYDEKGEEVLYSYGIENIADRQGRRRDLIEISELLEQNKTPKEILAENFEYRPREKYIRAAYMDKRLRETPLIKENMSCQYIFGESGVGKSHYYTEICEQFGEEEVYLVNDYQNGGMDFYMGQKILFLDEFRGMSFNTLLAILDKYSRYQIHSRYSNIYALWTTVIVASIYPPEEVYKHMVDYSNRAIDVFKQLKRRLSEIHYKYIDKEGNYCTYKLPASEYVDAETMKKQALGEEEEEWVQGSWLDE